MAIEDILATIFPNLNANVMNATTAANQQFTNATGYLTPSMGLYTPEGSQAAIDWYKQQAGGGFNPDGTALNGSIYGLPNVAAGESSIINWAAQNPNAGWAGPGSMMPTETRRQHEAADRLARDLSAAQIAANRYETDVNNQLQRDLQAGLISHQAAMQASQEAHEKALQANEMAYKYAELAWTKEYGTQNLQILRDRLAWDQEYGRGQLALDERRVGVAEGGLQLDKDKFGLEKAIQEAMLKANPMNAVANSLYMRGQQPQGGMDQFGAPNTTLDNSGVLPFLQQLQGGGITSRATGAGLGNSIGGNAAPQNGAISQASFGNMSDTERGITTSLAAFNGMNPQDYWSNMQSTWNTNGQRGMNFSTRLG